MQRNGSRQALMSRVNQLPQEIQAGLKNQSLQIADHAIYTVRSIAGTNRTSMFRDDDSKVVGLSNISSGKLEKGGMFCVTALRLQYGVSTNSGDDKPFGVSFGRLPDYIRNGEFELRANGASIMTQAPVELFNTEDNKDLVTSTLILDSPKVLRDLSAIEFNVEWDGSTPGAARAWLKLIMIGSGIVKA